MKKLFLAVLAASMLASCSKDKDPVVQAKLSFDVVEGADIVKFSEDGSTGSIDFAPQGGEVTIDVSTNQLSWSYKAEAGADWCTVVRDGDRLTITAVPNEKTESFSTEVTLTTGEADNTSSCVVTVRQAGVPNADLTLGQTELEFGHEGGSQEVTVATNQKSWVLRTESVNIRLIKGEGKLTVIVPENLKPEALTDVVTVVAGDGDNQTTADITVTQKAAPKVSVQIDPATLSFPAAGGTQNVVVTVTNYDSWIYQVTDENNWFGFEQEGDKLVVTAPKNRATKTYEAQVIIGAGHNSNSDAKLLTITQAPAENVDAMIIQLTIPDGGQLGVLPLEKVGSYTVDWADGSDVESLSSTFPSHQYAAGGVYEVIITGEVTKLNSSSSLILVKNREAVKYITGVVQWGTTGLKSMERAFHGAINLVSIPEDWQESFYDVTSFKYAFYNTGLVEVPFGLFASAVNATTFDSCFGSCASLAVLPSRLFSTCTSVTDFDSCFDSCKALKTIPDELFAGCSAATDFFRVFRYCTGLETIGKDVFKGCTQVTDFGQSFYNCSALKSIPAALFDECRKVTDFGNAFRGCSALTGESPYTTVGTQKVHLYERKDHPDTFSAVTGYSYCFKDCSGLTDYTAIGAAGWN